MPSDTRQNRGPRRVVNVRTETDVGAQDEMPEPGVPDLHQTLIQQLTDLRIRMLQVEKAHADRLMRVSTGRQASARNLLHYVSLRQQDLRSTQEQLLSLGLSSLGRCEANVQATLAAVIGVLCRLSGQQNPVQRETIEVDFDRSRQLLDQTTSELFGPDPSQGGAHIMVTMPSEAAHDRHLVSDFLSHGMDCMRINCAHDDANSWTRMIENLRDATNHQGRACKVLMDLAGPKLRTGPIESGPAVIKWKPRRDSLGRVIAPARIWFQRDGEASAPQLLADAVVPVIGDWLDALQPGDEVRFSDARGRSRRVRITDRAPGGIWGEADQTAYLTPVVPLQRWSAGRTRCKKSGQVGSLPFAEQYLVLHRGDRLLLTDECQLGSPARHDEHGQIIRPATIGCTLPSVFADLKPGERLLFDDGKITTCVEQIYDHHVVLEVTHAADNGTRLRADKGINLPDTELRLDALTSKDIEDLEFITSHSDIMAYSFVRRGTDVERLQAELTRLDRSDMPIVLKIENRQAFERLPTLLLAVMQSPVSGVMIARGDLAVELGWQRLAEVQEEILWMCEAAHMPVVWATQVLESLAKTGVPSRAEITDAAMAVRAECVMLNKGPYIVEALRVLGDIVRRMQDHQIKKRPLLRRLHLADDLLA